MKAIRFLIGDYAEKRKYLRDGENYVYADNDEVDGVIRIQGKDYFFLSKHPFGEFTALQYLSYCRALVNFSPMNKTDMKKICTSLGLKINPKAKLNSLNTIERRMLSVMAGFKPGCEVRINLDGYGYTRHRKKLLRRAVKTLSQFARVTISVSDSRFAFAGSSIEFVKCGYVYTTVASLKTKFVSKRTVARLLKKSSDNMPLPLSREIVRCS